MSKPLPSLPVKPEEKKREDSAIPTVIKSKASQSVVKKGEPVDYHKKNTKEQLSLLLDIYKLPPVDPINTDGVDERTSLYLDKCKATGIQPTVAGLALALGVSTDTLKRWRNSGCKQNPKVKPIIDRAYTFLEASLEGGMITGNNNAVGSIFDAKNRFGMKDQTEVVVSTKSSYDDEDSEQIADKYLEEQDLEIIDNDDVQDAEFKPIENE